VLTVIVPVYNEAATVEQLLEQVLREKTRKELLVVDDGSTDATPEILARWGRNLSQSPLEDHVCRVAIVRHSGNGGKGRAIRTGLEWARGEFVIVQDADLELDPEEYPQMCQPLVAGTADIVVGFRVARRSPPRVTLHRMGTRLLNLFVRILFRKRLTDEACCFKLLRTADLRRMQLNCTGFDFCPEVVAKASRLGLRFAEVPVTYRPRAVSAGKKLRLADGARAMATLWRYRHWRPAESTTPGRRAGPPVAGGTIIEVCGNMPTRTMR
jgi:glycosyltransferase involved in cell wall biosynthesis